MATPEVVTVNVAAVLPAATVMLAGTVAAVLLLARVTTNPPVGAAAVKVTVPFDVLPPMSEVGLSATLLKDVELMVSVAVLVTVL